MYGEGTDSNHRSHWAFALHPVDSARGHLLHVLLIDKDRLYYQFEIRKDVHYQSASSEGVFLVAQLTVTQYARVVRQISSEAAPRNGKDRCQDWCYNCIIGLEVEELVPAGTSHWIHSLLGLPAKTLAQRVGTRWKTT